MHHPALYCWCAITLRLCVEFKDTMMMGADYYQTESEIASLLAEGKVPLGVVPNTKIHNYIIDKNAKIGKDVVILNKEGIEEADRSAEGFYISSMQPLKMGQLYENLQSVLAS